jgi:hypothetical protein
VVNIYGSPRDPQKSLLDYGLMILQGCFKVLESRKNRTQDRWLYLFEKVCADQRWSQPTCVVTAVTISLAVEFD